MPADPAGHGMVTIAVLAHCACFGERCVCEFGERETRCEHLRDFSGYFADVCVGVVGGAEARVCVEEEYVHFV